MDKILKIIKAQYVKDYILRLTFNNGEIRLVDFTPLMQKGICTKLQDMDYFRSFTLDPNRKNIYDENAERKVAFVFGWNPVYAVTNNALSLAQASLAQAFFDMLDTRNFYGKIFVSLSVLFYLCEVQSK